MHQYFLRYTTYDIRYTLIEILAYFCYNDEILMQYTQKHRHFIALPIAGMALALIIAIHSVTPASIVRASRGTSSFDEVQGPSERILLSGTHVSLEEGAVASVSEDGVSLRPEQGSILVRAQGYAELNAGCSRVQSLRGTFYVSLSDTNLTIASVSGPLLVRLCSGTPRIIADAMQIVIKQGGDMAILPVDQGWIRQQLMRATDLDSPPVTTSMAPSEATTIMERSAVLVTLLQSAPVLHADDLRSALTMVDTIDADGFLRVLLALTLVRSSSLFDAPTVQLLGSALFSSSALDSDVAESLPRILLRSTFVLPESLHALWLDHALHSSVAQPLRALSLMEDISTLPAVLESSELPKQATLWRKNLMDVVRVLDPLLPPAERQELSTVRSTLMLTSLPLADVVSSVRLPSLQPKPLPVMSFDEKVLRTKEMLLQYGVLFTTDTRIDADQHDDQSVRVTGIFLSDYGRDTAYTFSYSPSRNLLHSIIRDGVALPNALSPDQFFRSMKKAP